MICFGLNLVFHIFYIIVRHRCTVDPKFLNILLQGSADKFFTCVPMIFSFFEQIDHLPDYKQ